VRIVVDRVRCESNAVCVGIGPDLFDIDDDDELQILDEHPAEEQRSTVEAAVRLCPKQALSIEEDE
jgi:ferredoxin